MLYSTHNWKFVKTLKPTYQEKRDAWVSVLEPILDAFPWSWWVTLSTKKPMPLEVIRGRFYWWLKCLCKELRHHVEFFWVIERQRRGALHVHAIISSVPTDDEVFWSKMINLWETSWTHGDEKFGDATIKKFDTQRAGNLIPYLAKERCKDLDLLEGSGSAFEKMGFSRNLKKFLRNPSSVRNVSGAAIE